MCSATGRPVAEGPTYTHREIDYRAIVPSLARGDRKQFDQFEASESITRCPWPHSGAVHFGRSAR